MSTITLEGLSKSFKGKTALDAVSLDIHSGELIALLGSSGCGKTTLLRVIAGLAAPDSGRVLFEGRDVTTLPTRLRPIGMVFQGYALFPNMTARQNIAFPLTVRGTPKAAIDRRVDGLLDLVGLRDRGDHQPHQLSGGQQQRTALARALAPGPSLLLLDEPLSALDALVRHHLRDEIRRIQQRLGITAVLVTHDQGEALAIADRVVVMRDGRIEQVASPDALYAAPATRFSAAFIGNRNALDLPVRDGRIRLWADAELATDLHSPRALLFLRTEDIHRIADGMGQPALIENRVFQGATTRLHLTLATEDGPLALRADWPSRLCAGLTIGDRVHVTVDLAAAQVFEA